MKRRLVDALARTQAEAWRELVPHPSAIRDELAMPRALVDAITRAADEAPELADALVRHYGELMPRMRLEQLASATAVGASLFHTPLAWERLPRLTAALDRLVAVLREAGVDPRFIEKCRRASTLAELYAQTHYGGCMPLLYGYPADLAYFLGRGLTLDATIDRYLTAPIIHELCHLERDRPALPPHLDECVAGWLGVHVWPPFAYPEPGEDDALYASPWLAQIGQALVRVFGLSSVLRAHAGQGGLPEDFLAAADALYWNHVRAHRPLHLLSNTLDPGPWLALITHGRTIAPDPDADRAIVEDGLRAMCLETTLVDGSFRTRTVLPAAPVVIDPAAGVITTAARALDAVPPAYWLPPTVPVTARQELTLTSLEDIPRIARALVP